MVQYDEDLVFRAFADPTRRSMLEHLDDGPLTVSALAAPLGITLTAVTQHVRTLERAGLITSEKHGRQRTCSLNHVTLTKAEAWIASRRTQWERRLDRLDRHLNQRTPDPKEDAQ